MVSRALQGFGACAFQSVGAAVIADIFRLEERGRAMGIYGCVNTLLLLRRIFVANHVSNSLHLSARRWPRSSGV